MRCASSISMSVGSRSRSRRKRRTTSCSRARRKGGASSLTWRVAGMSAPKGSASSGTQGSRSASHVPTAAHRRSMTTSSGSSPTVPMSGRRSSRQAAYAVEVVYASHVARRRVSPGARSRTSSISRVLPMPGSPVICTSRPVPRPTEATASSRRASSPVRPTSGKRSATPSRERLPIAGPTDHAWTGCFLPLTVNGSSRSVAKRVAERSRTPAVA